eukprot:gene2806-3245_t
MLNCMFHRSTVDDIKHTVLEEFKKTSSEIRVVVATSSFEMGLDFPDVSIGVNVSAPRSLESFVQKSGRGWRSFGKVSDCREINDPMDIDEEINIMLDDEQRNLLCANLEEYRDVFNVDNHLHEMSSRFPEIWQSDHGSEFLAETVKMLYQNNDVKVNCGDNREAYVTRKTLVNSISELAFEVRRSFYGRRLRNAPINLNSQLAMMDALYPTLYARCLSSMMSEEDTAPKEECYRKLTQGIDTLEKGHFAFFLYGMVSYERRQRPLLSKTLAEKGGDEGHCCSTYFSFDKNCVLECCREKAKDFAKRCGLLLLSKSNKKNAGNKIPEKKRRKKTAAGGRSRKGTKKIENIISSLERFKKRSSKARSTEHGGNDPK